MPTPSFKKSIQQLSLPDKVVGVGAAIGVISVFTPWYKDIDRFHTGDMFLGITGPLYLVGASLLLLYGGSLSVVISKAMKKDFFKIPVKTSVLHLLVGGSSFYLLCLAYSIFFHPQFGLNLVDKQPMFGLFGVLIASGLVSYGGYLHRKNVAIGSHPTNMHSSKQVSVPSPNVVEREHQPVHQSQSSYNVPVNTGPARSSVDDIQIKSELREFNDQ